MDGVEVCRLLRDGRATPIIVLSARGAEADKVGGAGRGRRRLRDQAVRRRGAAGAHPRGAAAVESTPASAGPIVRGDLVIDRDRHTVTRGDDRIRLTPKEFELLVFLAQHPGRVLTHRAILKAIWGPHAVDQPEHLRVLLGSLAEEDRARSVASSLHRDRAVGRLPVRGPRVALVEREIQHSTFTRGSPRNPSWRGSVSSATSCRTNASSTPRSRATRGT